MATVLERIELDEEISEPVLQEPGRMVLCLPPGLINSEEFFKICQLNDILRLERDANGAIIIMPPTVGFTGLWNSTISYQLSHWNRQARLGVTFDSSVGYELPSGLVLSPDASWVPNEQWNALTLEQKNRFLPFFPAFAVELLSPSDRLPTMRKKMRTYLDNGVRLAWLINPKKKQVEVYEPGKDPVLLDYPTSVSADPMLLGFVLDLTEIWE